MFARLSGSSLKSAPWVLLLCVVTGCLSKTDSLPSSGSGESNGGATSGSIKIDGSSTVYPISQAVAEMFNKEHPGVDIEVGLSGTGGGMKKFIVNEIDICDASRAIKDSEIEAAAAAGVEFVELQVAIDGLTVVVNPQNDWVNCITIAELKKIWEPGSTIKKWNEVNPDWPDHELTLYGADTDSGTFEYFTEVVNGKAKESRTDYTSNAVDNVLVQGVADNKFALGYFGYGYFAENQERLKALSIKADDAAECVAPEPVAIEAGTYAPMSRPLFVYVTKAALKRPEVAKFLEFYLSEEGQKLVEERKFIRMPAAKLAEMQQRLTDALK